MSEVTYWELLHDVLDQQKSGYRVHAIKMSQTTYNHLFARPEFIIPGTQMISIPPILGDVIIDNRLKLMEFKFIKTARYC